MSPGPGDDLGKDLSAAGRPSQVLGLWWLGALGLLVATALLLTGGLRPYGYALGATLSVLGLVRLLIPERRAGGLVVRGRWVDALTLFGLGVSVAVLAAYLRLG